MNETLTILSNMQWPAAVAIVGVALAVGVPLLVRRASRRTERIKELEVQRDVEISRFRATAIPHQKQGETY